MIYEILAGPRSGSTYLYHVINYYFFHFKRNNTLTGDLHEPFCFEQIAIIPVEETLSRLEGSGDHIIKNLLSDYQVLFLQGKQYYEKFMSFPKQRIILTRKDHFQRALSLTKANQLSKWNYYQKDNEYNQVVTLDTERFRFDLYKGLCEFLELKTKMKADDIVLDYSDLTLDPKIDYFNLKIDNKEIIDIPDMPDNIHITIKTPDKKTTIANYDELLEIYHTDLRFNDKLKELTKNSK
jgi:hypothetical protein